MKNKKTKTQDMVKWKYVWFILFEFISWGFHSVFIDISDLDKAQVIVFAFF